MPKISLAELDTTAYLALPPSGQGPGILLLHAWWGLNGFFETVAEQLAAQGFVVLAPDMNKGQIASTVEQAEALMQARDFEYTQQVVAAACDSLRAQDGTAAGPLGVVGFSMGAAWALWLAVERPAEIGAASVFYGTYALEFAKAQAVFQGHFAENDEWEPLDGVHAMQADMEAAGRSFELYVYPGTAHWFVEDDRPEYTAEAADLAWQRTFAFLEMHLKGAAHA